MVRVPLTADELRRGRALGALLRQARGTRTLLDVAGAAGISPETLRKIETGRIPTRSACPWTRSGPSWTRPAGPTRWARLPDGRP
jgi:DNA-binding XRE family transcriptional regulator